MLAQECELRRLWRLGYLDLHTEGTEVEIFGYIYPKRMEI